MASTYLSRSVTTTGNQRTWTFSAWVKRSKLGSVQYIVSAKNVGETTLYFRAQDDLQLELYDGNNYYIRTNRLFRDTNAWYHIVAIWDSVRPTSSDRMRLYVNGVQETSFSVAVYPPQNYDSYMNQSGETNYVGNYHSGSSSYYDGSMSHVHLIDGNDYNATYFGEYDANGVWKIKTSPSVTYGTNGFFILKDGNSVTDQSGNSNNFTVAGGTLTNTEDCPSNVFATWNPLYNYVAGVSFSNGNTQYKSTETVTGPQSSAPATIAVSSGKYYAEILLDTFGGANPHIGVCPVNLTSAPYWGEPTSSIPMITHGVNYNSASGVVTVTSTSQGTFPTFTSGDYIGIALDMDNERVYFSKNGTWINSANPSAGTGYFDFSSVRTDTNEAWVIGAGAYGGTIWRANFGNGYFGTTAVASAGTNASGNGIFEYDVPTGYTALSTKGLNL